MSGSANTTLRSVDSTVANLARRYNYWLGGKDHFAADRESGDAIAAVFPGIRDAVAENRRFLRRVVTYLAREGIRQFLDIGTGIPTAPNTHEVVQSIAPASRVVYVDNDPIVMVHARALMTSAPEGAIACIDADLRNPDAILNHSDLGATLDLSQPVAVLVLAVLQFIDDNDDPFGIITRLVGALPAGSYLAISHPTFDVLDPTTSNRLEALVQVGGAFRPRTQAEVARFVGGLELVDPGIRSITEWRPDDEPRPQASVAETAMYGVVARVPNEDHGVNLVTGRGPGRPFPRAAARVAGPSGRGHPPVHAPYWPGHDLLARDG